MRRLSPEEKEQLKSMVEQQNRKQEEKRQHYREFKRSGGRLMDRPDRLFRGMPAPQPSRYHMNGDQRFEHIEKKYEQVEKHSELRRIHLTEKEKEELKKKIREASEQKA